MAWQVTNLPNLVPTSSGSSFTSGVGSLDDAEALTVYITSSAGTGSSGTLPMHIQVSQFDPAISAPAGVTQSTGWFTLGMQTTSGVIAIIMSTGLAYTVSPIAFRGIRLANLTSAASGEVVAHLSKQLFV